MRYVMGGQFYLAWHCNYNDRFIVCDRAGLRGIIDALSVSGWHTKPTDDMITAAYALDLTPRVVMGDSTVSVSVSGFTNWGGLFREEYVFHRHFPHLVDTAFYRSEVNYDCGIMF